ncbi:hypothetical protein CERSUDRAFT_98615 [Gelatoporia subvermispora B]|uniref:Sodium/calcium exchanger membrane region domain-containing protein n=1 Tax=Ceriporiopsis subvermispora (strain B) TaxID=914234 RepID=M2R5T7_CERS8|nr:hypothetical protein CERSUDRAFT_98615 [Gelatoporia subvermispora B]
MTTTDPLAAYNQAYDDRRESSPMPDRERRYPDQLSAIPFPVMTRTTSQSSSTSYNSTSELVPHTGVPKASNRFSERVFSSLGWPGAGRRYPGGNDPGMPPGQDKGGGKPKMKPVRAWEGWRLIIFDSWLNVLVLLIPATWVLKLATTDSHTLIFSACALAMIPLVKLHDLSINMLSRRIGGTKTGLLNASMVEQHIAALRKCELRVVQSSIIGSMLSKLLLILGMCFFAGGLRFSEQDFDSTATQIHSSLLSISVGAVLLPAAYHFALTYSSEDAIAAGTTLEDQKQDLLKMSHGVSIVLLIIYVSYLLFQLWSHTHLYQDSAKPSAKLPASISVRSVTSRVRQKSNSLRERFTSKSSLALSEASLRQTPMVPVSSPYPAFPAPATAFREREKASPVEEAPETCFDDSVAERERAREKLPPYTFPAPAPQRPERTALLMSPFGAASQVTLSSSPGPGPAPHESTVRLVRLSGADSSGDEMERPGGSWGNASGSAPGRNGRSSPVSEVLSAYFAERGDVVPAHPRGQSDELDSRDFGRNVSGSVREAGRKVAEIGHRGRAGMEALRVPKKKAHEEAQMSWTLTLLLLTVVTVLVAINSEWLVDSMDGISPTISKEWIGLILLPTVSSIAECVTAINVSVQDQLTLSISVAVGSTIQTALFVIPFMVILGWILDKPLALLFDPFESVVLYISVHTMGYVVADGKSNWLEGVILVCLYVVIAVAFWFYPGSNFSSSLAVCSS